MKKINNKYILTLCLFTIAIFSACDNEEESISFTPGTNLIISGSDEILSFDQERYNVEGFTVSETYTWSISGDGEASVSVVEGRDGEFVEVFAEDAGEYTLTVENNAGLSGSYVITVVDVNEFVGVGQDTLRITEDQYLAGADTLFFPITISNRNVDSTAVEFSIVDGTAVEGVDFTVLNTTNVLGFAAGETEAYIKILTIDNKEDNGSRYFDIVIGDIVKTGIKSSAVEQAPDSLKIGLARIFITDDEKVINLDVAADTLEVNSAGNYFVNVSLNKALTDDLTVQYSVLGLPALSNADKTNGSVTFFAGETEAQIVIEIAADWVAEGANTTNIAIQLDNIISDDNEAALGTTSSVVLKVQPEEEE